MGIETSQSVTLDNDIFIKLSDVMNILELHDLFTEHELIYNPTAIDRHKLIDTIKKELIKKASQ